MPTDMPCNVRLSEVLRGAGKMLIFYPCARHSVAYYAEADSLPVRQLYSSKMSAQRAQSKT